MNGAYNYRVFTSDGVCIAACADLFDVAAIIARRGKGTQVRDAYGQNDDVLWTEGAETYTCAEYYEGFAQTIKNRLRTLRTSRRLRTMDSFGHAMRRY